MPKSPKYLTDEHGKRIGVVLAVKDYAKMIEALEDLDDIRAYDEAKASKEEAVPFRRAIKEIERSRKRTK